MLFKNSVLQSPGESVLYQIRLYYPLFQEAGRQGAGSREQGAGERRQKRKIFKGVYEADLVLQSCGQT